MNALIPEGFPLVMFFLTIFTGWHLIPRVIAQWQIQSATKLPIKIRCIWPLIVIIAAFVHWTDLVAQKKRLSSHLGQSGIGQYLSPEQYVALKILNGLLAAWFTSQVTRYFQVPSIAMVWLAAACGFVAPSLWLKKCRAQRQQMLISDLPNVIDFLRIALMSGLNFSGALQQAIQKGPEGTLKQEFIGVINDIRTGNSRMEALKRSMDRVGLPEYSALIQSIIHAENSGASLTETLQHQAEQRRNERFYRAEKAALQAPVKLVFPLVAFIFPVSFLILFFPIAMRFFEA